MMKSKLNRRMAKPVSILQQRNYFLKGSDTASPFSVTVDSEGRSTNATGFSGYASFGGPVLNNCGVLTLPDDDVTLTVDQLVDTDLCCVDFSVLRTATLPTASSVLNYLTKANAASSARYQPGDVINLGTIPFTGGVVQQAAQMIPVFETRITVPPGSTLRLSTPIDIGIKPKGLAQPIAYNTLDLIAPVDPVFGRTFILRWYCLNTGGLTAPNDVPQFALVVTN